MSSDIQQFTVPVLSAISVPIISESKTLNMPDIDDYVEIDGVRIYPSLICFTGAYDGKEYDEKFQVINMSRRPAFVRIFPSTSKGFEMKPLPKGVMLASGLSVVRHIKYKFLASVALPHAFIYIYINEKSVLYPIEVRVALSAVKIAPKLLHFGDIDVGTASKQLSLFLNNQGQRNATFSIDLGRNDLELIVDPMRATIQPKQKQEVKVEVLGSKEGHFLKEFWVKTEPLQRVWITGTFIHPKLKIEHPFASNFDLMVIDFPVTYYNAQNCRVVIIKNTSSMDSMYCTVVEYRKHEDIKLDEARKLNDNLKFFHLTPKDGRLIKNHKAVISVKFKPYKVKTMPQKYAIIFVKIVKINCRDGSVKGKELNVKTFSSNVSKDSYQIESVKSIELAEKEEKKYEYQPSYLRICLYGEIEEAKVKLTPSAIDRNNLIVGEEYNLTFNIKNESNHLPITFKYEKVACFEMEPSEATINRAASLDILLILHPHSMGKFSKNIALTLYFTNRDGNVFKVGVAHLRFDYEAHHNKKNTPMLKPKYNMGLTPQLFNKVGSLVHNITYANADINKVPVQAFGSYSQMKKTFVTDNTNMIAFPNDRPGWLCSAKNTETCTTIFTHMPRYSPPIDYTHTFTPSKLALKNRNKEKFTDIMRNNFMKVEIKQKQDHMIYPTSASKLLLTNEKMATCLSPFSENKNWPKFIPLTPEELMDIEITPRYVDLEKIAPNILCSEFFEIKNKNKFSIIINIMALSNCVVIKGKKRQQIEAMKSAKVFFDCISHGLGKYYVPVYITINDFHIFDAVVFAEVVPTTVRCKNKEVFIKAKDNVGYLELYNPVNCAIDFDWDIQDSNYSITPLSGTINSRKSLYCKITFTPTVESVFRTEIYLLSQSGAKQIVRVSNEKVKSIVKFSTHSIDMRHTPLNIAVSKLLVVRNESEQKVVLFVKDPNPIEQVTISPTEVTLEGKGDTFFKVTAHFKTITTFACSFEFGMPDDREQAISVTGNIAYPNVVLEPEFMHIPKIVTKAYQRRVFRVNNNCLALTKIKFLVDNYPDLTITDLSGKKFQGELVLAPKQYVELFLEFEPKEPTAYTLYLPYIINDIIGPPLLNNPNSFKLGTYLVPPSPHINKAISILRITCAAGAPWLKFSSLHLRFREDNLSTIFVVTNVSAVFRQVKFMIGSLKTCFQYQVVSCSGKYKIVENYLKFYLQPRDTVKLEFHFSPKDYGVYTDSVPFYVNDYFENCPFNYIRLKGTTDKPIIKAKNRLVNMPCIPVDRTYLKTVKLELLYHQKDCVISLENDDDYLRIDKQLVNETLEIFVTFVPKSECTLVSEIKVYCTCEAYCKLLVTAECDNCSLLSYRHKMMSWSDIGKPITKQESVFDRCNQNFLKSIEKMRVLLENHTFSQGFFATYFYNIPDTICRYPYNAYVIKAKGTRKKKNFHLPIVTMFKNLSYPGIVHHITDGEHFGNLEERHGAAYDYSVYKNIFRYLEEYNVFVKNLSPELLLSYDRYIVFKSQLIDDENLSGGETLSEQEFNFLSKQCWLDLLIKMYKLLHYDRLLKDEPPQTGRLDIDDVYQEEFGLYYASQIESFPSSVNECEAKLMLWLEFHFKEQKGKLWPDYNLPDRPIRNLCKDVRDSLPLATIMAAYCPYLAGIFKEIYFEESKATTHCPLHHNACLISEAWNRLNLSFKISTNSIFEPTNTEMLFLLAYLYIVLPSFYPVQTITIKSYLGQTKSTKILLKNPGPVSVNYTSIIFLNDNESFQTNSETIVIPAKCEKSVTVSYTAKQIIREEAVLVLSGESGGQKYSKSMAINLFGIPDILYFEQAYKMRVELYQTVTKTIDVASPYCQPYHANTYFYLYQEGKPPLTMKDFVSVNALPDLPRQLELDGVCAFDEEGMHKLSIKLCFISLGEWTYYIYFINKEVGIFSIQVLIRAEMSNYIGATLHVRLKTNFDVTAPCKCKPRVRNLQCPRILYAEIPYQNHDLIDGLRNMIKIYARHDEIEFWKQHLVFPKGFHIFRAYLENTYYDNLVPFKVVLHPSVTFFTIPEGTNYTVDPTIHFDNSTAEGCYRLLIHWDSSEEPTKEILQLMAEHGLEKRSYVLKFSTSRELGE